MLMIHEKKEIWKAAIKQSIQAMGPEWLSRACGSHCRAKDCMEKAMVLLTLGCFDTKDHKEKTVMPTPNHVPAVLGANQIFR